MEADSSKTTADWKYEHSTHVAYLPRDLFERLKAVLGNSEPDDSAIERFVIEAVIHECQRREREYYRTRFPSVRGRSP